MNQRADSLTIQRLGRPQVTSIVIGAIFVAVAAFYVRLAIDLTPEENTYRLVIMAVISLVVILLGVFIHLYIFRKTASWLAAYRHHQSAGLRTAFLQDVWVEINNYPAKFCLYVFGYCLYGVVLFAGLFIMVPFVIRTMPSTDYLIHLTAAVSLIAWPLATLMYFVLERNQRKLAGIFLAENVARIRVDDPRIVRFSVRTKLLAAFLTTTGMASFFVGSTLYFSYHKNFDDFVTNLAVALSVTIGYGMAVAMLTARSVGDSIHGIQKSVRGQRTDSGSDGDWLHIPSGFSSDELGFLYSSLTQFFETFRHAMTAVDTHVADLHRRTQDITAAAHSQKTVTTQHHDAITVAAGSFEALSQSLAQLAAEGERISELIRQGQQTAEAGKERIERTLESIEQIRQEAAQNSRRVMDLSLKMIQIEEVIKIINYVTDQTKILAFNASIETAAAGDVGERFGVVAKEIRQLAQNIAHSTDEIKGIIEDVRKATHGSVLAAEKELKQIQAGLLAGGEAHDAYFDMFELVRQTSASVTAITQALTQQRVAQEQVWKNLQNLDRYVRETIEHNRVIAQSSEATVSAAKGLSTAVSGLADHPSVSKGAFD